ncbi:DNA polymerase III subunits gamma and tau [Oceanicaulis alexandrii HTCC2633]|uniref:DNA polymerase III subunit gamma/tau n=1 Tax=Oceanicaulis sp. HTCC2633 TaxID=314254 RepID=UPI0000668B1B|nr:DNA polymerase III subunit gamma/tau [Oceanicaulis sp. HTCC2633]EAP90672.1 DNA polymerase III subunits gamma and tau [Oceanicaulis alexandrii HTCC2633] [Oceanicaulis sp. HTCC2633]
MDDPHSDAPESDAHEAYDGPALPGLEPEAPRDSGYQVLARKYRPQTFDDLIGQEPMVRTLTNAFASGRIAHAYMMTGVRGVGKTTTARLIARALNYETDEVHQPSIRLTPPGRHCDAIARSAHVDVMEMDAASRTGISDIREILDGVRYAPVSARYKVYIIDEVHMLSTSAFNALLKTLEEPPEHVKFIFATTEIRKVPVTVLSRCQRFDLKRVDRDVLTDHLARICEKENASVECDGLAAIARAAEGSVRDALSLLDQAIVQADAGQSVTADQIRDMLGLADRSRVLDLLEAALENRAKDALDELRHQYDTGADPQVLMRDLLDHLHAVSRIKAAGPSADLGEAQETVERLAKLAEAHSLASLGRLWKTALTGLEDVRNAPDPVSAAEMAVIRLMAAASLPSPEDAARLLAGVAAPSGGGANPSTGPGGAPSGPQASYVAPEPEFHGPKDLDALIALVDEARDIGLKLDIERCFRPVSIKPGAIVFEPTQNAPSNLGGRIAAFLQEQTGERWLVDSKPKSKGGETIAERRERQHEERMDAVRRDPAMVKALTLFPGAEILTVDDAAPLPTSEDEDDTTARQETSR